MNGFRSRHSRDSLEADAPRLRGEGVYLFEAPLNPCAGRDPAELIVQLYVIDSGFQKSNAWAKKKGRQVKRRIRGHVNLAMVLEDWLVKDEFGRP